VEPPADGPTLGGRYRLERRLGSGGMGSVWRAHDQLLGRHVAIKLVDPGAAAERLGSGERLRREARAVGALAHPGVARLFDYCDTPEGAFLVMELAEGESLAAQLIRGPIPAARAVDIAAQCADALDAAHRAGVVHRDVKPSNIMLTSRGVKLVDFGIASTAGDSALTAAGRVLGTAAYLAPERATGRPATSAADLYALGVVLYQMLAGRLPFRADDPVSMMYAHTAADPLPLSGDIPAALAEICRALLAKDPQARPRTGAAVARMLRAASLEREDPATRQPWQMATAPQPPREPVAPTGVLPPSAVVRRVRRPLAQRIRTRRAAALAVGATAVLLVSALSGWLAHGNSASPPPAQPSHSAPAGPTATNPASTQPTPGRQQADQTTPGKGKGKGKGRGGGDGGGNG
jgi:serine/threonine-protein kinase